MYFSDLESRLVNAEAANNSLQRKNVALAETKSALERDLDDKELQINAHKRDQQKSSRKLKTQLSQQEVIFQLVELYFKSLIFKGIFLVAEYTLRCVKEAIKDSTHLPYCPQVYEFDMSSGRIIYY